MSSEILQTNRLDRLVVDLLPSSVARWAMTQVLLQLVTIAVVLATTLSSLPAGAQTPARSLEDLLGTLKPGDTVWVTDETRAETKGQVVDLAPSALALTTDQGRREFRPGSITRVQQRRPDPLWNGAVIGALVALAPMIWWYAPQTESGETAGDSMAFISLMLGLGAGAGAGIDALKQGRKTIYLAPDGSVARRHLTPMLSRGEKGVNVSLLFRVTPKMSF